MYKRARVHAAEHGTSVSGLVTKYLMSLTSRDDQYERLKRLQQSVYAEIIGSRAEDRSAMGLPTTPTSHWIPGRRASLWSMVTSGAPSDSAGATYQAS